MVELQQETDADAVRTCPRCGARSRVWVGVCGGRSSHNGNGNGKPQAATALEFF